MMIFPFYVILILHCNVISLEEVNVRNKLYGLSYMDNLSYSTSDASELMKTFRFTHELFNKFCFKLQQFHTNNQELSHDCQFEDGKETVAKLLDLNWNFVEDRYLCKDNQLNLKAISKREILSSVNGIFDPLGILLLPLIEQKYFYINCKVNIPNGMKNYLPRKLKSGN